MAKLTAPLMSFGATGQLGNSLVFSTWKGIPTVRQKVTPSNPNTTGQQTQRSFMRLAVAFFRTFMTGAAIKVGWNRQANLSGSPQSGFNAFTSNAVQAAVEETGVSFVTTLDPSAPDEVIFQTANLDTGDPGTEAGDFTLQFGTAPDQLLNSYTDTLDAGELSFSVQADFPNPGTYYGRVTKLAGGFNANRSGIVQIIFT